MDYRNILAVAAVIFALGTLVQSLQNAYAFPQGPNVGTGFNPIENFYGAVALTGRSTGGSGLHTVFVNSTDQDFILTQFLSNSDNCTLSIDGSTIFSHYSSIYGTSSVSATNFTGTLKIASGSTTSIANLANGTLNCTYYIEGFYVRP